MGKFPAKMTHIRWEEMKATMVLKGERMKRTAVVIHLLGYTGLEGMVDTTKAQDFGTEIPR
eukprot:9657369-Heterocapsa_arctica.AAC.1